MTTSSHLSETKPGVLHSTEPGIHGERDSGIRDNVQPEGDDGRLGGTTHGTHVGKGPENESVTTGSHVSPTNPGVLESTKPGIHGERDSGTGVTPGSEGQADNRTGPKTLSPGETDTAPIAAATGGTQTQDEKPLTPLPTRTELGHTDGKHDRPDTSRAADVAPVAAAAEAKHEKDKHDKHEKPIVAATEHDKHKHDKHHEKEQKPLAAAKAHDHQERATEPPPRHPDHGAPSTAEGNITDPTDLTGTGTGQEANNRDRGVLLGGAATGGALAGSNLDSNRKDDERRHQEPLTKEDPSTSTAPQHEADKGEKTGLLAKLGLGSHSKDKDHEKHGHESATKPSEHVEPKPQTTTAAPSDTTLGKDSTVPNQDEEKHGKGGFLASVLPSRSKDKDSTTQDQEPYKGLSDHDRTAAGTTPSSTDPLKGQDTAHHGIDRPGDQGTATDKSLAGAAPVGAGHTPGERESDLSRQPEGGLGAGSDRGLPSTTDVRTADAPSTSQAPLASENRQPGTAGGSDKPNLGDISSLLASDVTGRNAPGGHSAPVADSANRGVSPGSLPPSTGLLSSTADKTGPTDQTNTTGLNIPSSHPPAVPEKDRGHSSTATGSSILPSVSGQDHGLSSAGTGGSVPPSVPEKDHGLSNTATSSNIPPAVPEKDHTHHPSSTTTGTTGIGSNTNTGSNTGIGSNTGTGTGTGQLSSSDHKAGEGSSSLHQSTLTTAGISPSAQDSSVLDPTTDGGAKLDSGNVTSSFTTNPLRSEGGGTGTGTGAGLGTDSSDHAATAAGKAWDRGAGDQHAMTGTGTTKGVGEEHNRSGL